MPRWLVKQYFWVCAMEVFWKGCTLAPVDTVKRILPQPSGRASSIPSGYKGLSGTEGGGRHDYTYLRITFCIVTIYWCSPFTSMNQCRQFTCLYILCSHPFITYILKYFLYIHLELHQIALYVFRHQSQFRKLKRRKTFIITRILFYQIRSPSLIFQAFFF